MTKHDSTCTDTTDTEVGCERSLQGKKRPVESKVSQPTWCCFSPNSEFTGRRVAGKVMLQPDKQSSIFQKHTTWFFFLNVKLKTSYCLNVIMFITNEDVAVRDSRRRGTNMLMHSCSGSERKVTVSNPWTNPRSYLWGGAEKRKLSRLCRNLPYRHNQTATQGSQLVTARCEPTVGSSRWRDGLPWVCASWPATVPCGEEWLPWSPV